MVILINHMNVIHSSGMKKINNDPFLEHMFRIHTHAQCTIFTKTYIVPARQPVLPEEDTGLQSEREKDTKFAHNVCDLLH